MAQSLDDLGLAYGTDKSSDGHSYLRFYERFLAPFRDDEFTLIEIGGYKGASLRMWSDYFPRASIVCLDVNPDVATHAGGRVTVEIGDAGSKRFLAAMVEKYKAARVILDDGSHRWDHQRAAFKHLFPIVEPGGLYICEDIHTSFEPGFAGQDDVPFTDFLKLGIDYLSTRHDSRKALEARYNRQTIACFSAVETMTFIRRACIITKSARRRTR